MAFIFLLLELLAGCQKVFWKSLLIRLCVRLHYEHRSSRGKFSINTNKMAVCGEKLLLIENSHPNSKLVDECQLKGKHSMRNSKVIKVMKSRKDCVKTFPSSSIEAQEENEKEKKSEMKMILGKLGMIFHRFTLFLLLCYGVFLL